MHFVGAPVMLSGDIHICLTTNESHGNTEPNRTCDKRFPVTDDYKHFHQFLLIVLTLTRRLTYQHTVYEQENRKRQTFLHVCVHRGLYVNTRALMQFYCVEDQTSDLPVSSSCQLYWLLLYWENWRSAASLTPSTCRLIADCFGYISCFIISFSS